ncbi:MAG: biopolymer transporter ExbD [Rhodothermaceae bacterium]
MSMIKKKKNREVSIEAGSMADITFLLLLFFLVTTTIDVDTGIYLTLPEYIPPEEIEVVNLSKDRFITVNINETGDVLISGERMAVSNIQEFLTKKIEERVEMPKNKKLLISIKTARGTDYNLYVQTLDAIKGAYFDVQESYCQRKFGKAKYQIDAAENEELKEKIPTLISLAEPEEDK